MNKPTATEDLVTKILVKRRYRKLEIVPKHLSGYATYEESAESISKDQNDLEEAEAEEPISNESSKIKRNLRTRQEVQKTADRHTRKPDIPHPNSRSGIQSISVGLSLLWCRPICLRG